MKTRTISVAALAIAIVVGAGATQVVLRAQNPNLRWVKAAPFPEPEEELYGATANGKMYVIGGFASNGKPAAAMVYEYDPAADKWTKKKSIPVPVHHQAQTVLNGKIYIFGGCQRPLTGPGAGGWAPVDNAWEYDPVADTYKALAPMPGKRCSAIAENVGGKIYVVGGWATYNGKIYVSGGEYQNERYNAAYRSLDAYDPVANRWEILPSLPGAVHGNAVAFIGNKFHTVSGKMEGGGLPDLPGKATADHSVMEMPAGGTQ